VEDWEAEISDKEVRDLVEAIATWPGVRVIHACARDVPTMADFYEGYVIVEAHARSLVFVD